MLIKLICFDICHTLIEENTWYKLNVALGMSPEEDEKYFKLYREGKLSYQDWTKTIFDIYRRKGRASFENINKAVAGYTYKTGARETIDYLKNKGYKIALITGGMDLLVDKIAKDLGVGLTAANTSFVFDENNYLKEMISVGDEPETKVHHLNDFCRKLGIDFDECAAVGDGANDVDLFLKTGHGITFRGSKIENKAWKVIDELPDLKKLF
jgi:phosphoserine phosphatase